MPSVNRYHIMMEDSLNLHVDINLNFGLLTHMALLFILSD